MEESSSEFARYREKPLSTSSPMTLQCPPEYGWHKFNVDGAACKKSGSTRIDGVLRDVNGRILIKFSINIGFGESKFSELQAINEAF